MGFVGIFWKNDIQKDYFAKNKHYAPIVCASISPFMLWYFNSIKFF